MKLPAYANEVGHKENKDQSACFIDRARHHASSMDSKADQVQTNGISGTAQKPSGFYSLSHPHRESIESQSWYKNHYQNMGEG